jgi:phosphatidylserine/phosphatidylglycerophosphate/cardiolipin synthase-like enzyme
MSSLNTNVDLYNQSLSYRSNAAPYQCLAQPWFIRTPFPTYYPRYRCSIEPLICGQKVFGKIAEDLEKAQHSVDIITWGFDPGMVLVRGRHAEDGVRYGDLLKKIASRKDNPVKVRLIVWHDDAVSHMLMNNNPGYYGKRFPSIGCIAGGYYNEHHQNYNAQWFAQVCANELPNIHFHVREVPHSLLEQSLSGEPSPVGIAAKTMANATQLYATHHQKMLLIDYERPATAVGYVMGHNSITDFWDTEKHAFRDRLRERFYTRDHAELQKQAWKSGERYGTPVLPGYSPSARQQELKARLVQADIEKHSYVAKPYQDVSCRLRGPILYDLNHNFCEAWQESTRPTSMFMELGLFLSIPLLPNPYKLVKKIGDWLHSEMDADSIARRKKISLGAFDLCDGQHTVQLLRTQPLYKEKAAKECYANLTRQMLSYIFIQNQYIQYGPWADHLMECVGRLRSAGYLKPMYVFILTSTPEKAGMDLPTYDVASKLGKSASMKVEHATALEEARANVARLPISPEELADRGINVVMGSMWTCAETDGKLLPTDCEEIYIHAKVAVVDDAAFTIGSANLNMRSMALDSELNVLSEAKDVAFKLRCDLFSQCTGDAGPPPFGDMFNSFVHWQTLQIDNARSKLAGTALLGQLLPFHVDRKPGIPVI